MKIGITNLLKMCSRSIPRHCASCRQFLPRLCFHRYVSVCSQEEVVLMSLLPMMHWNSLYRAPPGPGPLQTWGIGTPGPAPASDIWWPSLETCSNLFIGPHCTAPLPVVLIFGDHQSTFDWQSGGTLEQGNVFTSICHSVHGGGGLPDRDTPGQRPPWTVKSGRYTSLPFTCTQELESLVSNCCIAK